MPLIDTENLTKIYRDDGVETPALRHISFSIEKGEFVAIMGPSGSGKSTLLHVLGFLDRQSSGHYRFDGREMGEYTEDDLARIRNQKMGFVFQAFNLLARASVLDNVRLPLLYSETDESQWSRLAKEAIDHVGLSHRLNHVSSQLSGGEKQRVAIARALVNEPQVIFADEPTGNLDSKSGIAVMQIFEKLHAEGHTVILITHETNTAEYAERIIHIMDGTISSDRRVPDSERRHAHDGELK
jgi:putative ABC transport system ATP-binding protein